MSPALAGLIAQPACKAAADHPRGRRREVPSCARSAGALSVGVAEATRVRVPRLAIESAKRRRAVVRLGKDSSGESAAGAAERATIQDNRRPSSSCNVVSSRCGVGARGSAARRPRRPERLLLARRTCSSFRRAARFGTAIIEAMACALPCVVAGARHPDYIFAAPEARAEGSVVVPQEDAEAFVASLAHWRIQPGRRPWAWRRASAPLASRWSGSPRNTWPGTGNRRFEAGREVPLRRLGHCVSRSRRSRARAPWSPAASPTSVPVRAVVRAGSVASPLDRERLTFIFACAIGASSLGACGCRAVRAFRRRDHRALPPLRGRRRRCGNRHGIPVVLESTRRSSVSRLVENASIGCSARRCVAGGSIGEAHRLRHPSAASPGWSPRERFTNPGSEHGRFRPDVPPRVPPGGSPPVNRVRRQLSSLARRPVVGRSRRGASALERAAAAVLDDR